MELYKVKEKVDTTPIRACTNKEHWTNVLIFGNCTCHIANEYPDALSRTRPTDRHEDLIPF